MVRFMDSYCGKATITAEARNGMKDSIEIQVIDEYADAVIMRKVMKNLLNVAKSFITTLMEMPLLHVLSF